MVEALGVSIHVTLAFPLEEDSGLVGSAPDEWGSDGVGPVMGPPIKESKVMGLIVKGIGWGTLVRDLLNCTLSGAVTSPSAACVTGVPEKAMFLLLPLPLVVDAVTISAVCRWKRTGLRPEDPRLGRDGSPVGSSECLTGESGQSAAVGMEPARVRLNGFIVDKDRPTPLTLSDCLFDEDGFGGAKCVAWGDEVIELPDARGVEGKFAGETSITRGV